MSNEVTPHHRTPKTFKNYFTVDTAKMDKVFFKHFMGIILLFRYLLCLEINFKYVSSILLLLLNFKT